MRILLTGATGHLGRHVLFEYIQQHWDKLETLDIILLGRGDKSTSFEQRMKHILLNDGLDYLKSRGFTWAVKRRLKRFFQRNIRCMECHLEAPEMGLRPTDRQHLLNLKIDEVFHVAAITDFRDSSAVRAALSLNILQGTKRMLELATSLNIGAFNYISTAYVCGTDTGHIRPTPCTQAQNYRNPYEQIKAQAEALLPYFEAQTGLPTRIFRPSTICGRMMEGTLGTTSKFDVFYGWASFFAREIQRAPSHGAAPVRIHHNANAGLNIVPVDYCAKLMLAICNANTKGGIFHLAHDQNLPHNQWIGQVMAELNVENTQLTTVEPTDKTLVEQRYYRTVGKLFRGYLLSASLHFDMENTRDICTDAKLACPALDEKGFAALLAYAHAHNFGLPLQKGVKPPSLKRAAFLPVRRTPQISRSV
jgi:nucleoside-diphosphate-sugar epimerase